MSRDKCKSEASGPSRSSQSDQPLRALFWMILSGIGFSIMASLVKALSPKFPQFELVLFRSGVNFVIQLGLVFLLGERVIRVPNRRLLVFRGLMGFAGVSCLFYALGTLPLSIAAMLNWCSPIFVILFSRLFLKEKLNPTAPIWIALAFAGLILLIGIDLSGAQWTLLPPMAVAVGLGGAAFAGLAYVAVRAATARVSVHVIILYFSGIGTFLAAPLALKDFRVPDLESGFLLIIMGCCAALGQFAMTQGYRHAVAGLVSMMSLMNAGLMAFLGWVIFGEVLESRQWVGLGFLACAVSFLTWFQQRALKKS